jgi:hypothetical protein
MAADEVENSNSPFEFLKIMREARSLKYFGS